MSGPGISGLKRIRSLLGEKGQTSNQNVGKRITRASSGAPTPRALDGNEACVVSKVLAGRKRCLSLDTHQTKELSVNLGEQGGASGNSKESTTNLHEQDKMQNSSSVAEPLAAKVTKTPNVVAPDDLPIDTSSTPATNNIVAPAANTTMAPTSKIIVAPKVKRAVRGVSRGESLEKLVEKHGKLKISFLPGENVSVSGDEQFSSAIGIIARGHADIGKEVGGWEEVSSNSKDFCYARLGHFCDIEDHDTPRVQKIIDHKFQIAYTRWRHVLHTAYKSLVAKGISPRSVSPRTDVTLEKWQLACDFIEDENFKKRSSINVQNRGKMMFDQTTGRTPFLRRFKTMEKKSEIEFFKLTRSKKGGEFVNSVAKEKYDEMIDMRNKSIENDEEQISEPQIVKATLGHKSGYIKGMGHGLQASRGSSSSMTAGIDIKEKLSELDRANEKIANLTKKCEEQGNSVELMKAQMLQWEKIMEKMPAISQVSTDDIFDEEEEV